MKCKKEKKDVITRLNKQEMKELREDRQNNEHALIDDDME